jgi:hypothetical protein
MKLQLADQKHLVHDNDIVCLRLEDWLSNALTDMAQSPGFGLRSRSSLSTRVGSYLVETRRYQPDPRPFGLARFAEFMHIFHGDKAESIVEEAFGFAPEM